MRWQPTSVLAGASGHASVSPRSVRYEIDRDPDVTGDGKYRQRIKTAAQAIADFEASQTLVRARQADKAARVDISRS